jgi:hypothetical protein
MRQVFTSPRIENVEGVARLLEEAGIEVRITHGRSYRGAIRGNFSYRDSEREKKGPQPAVWIVKSEDQPRAREMLRGAGLLESTRMPQDSYLSQTLHARDTDARGGDARRRRAFRIKLGLLVLIAAVIGLGFLGMREATRVAPAIPTAAPIAAPAASAPTEPVYVVATPPALAEMLLQIELDAQAPDRACIAVDGKDPPANMLARMRMEGRDLRPLSACEVARADLRIDVSRYTTDGSGTGSVRLDMVHRTAAGEEQSESRTLQVRRTGDAWRVLRML